MSFKPYILIGRMLTNHLLSHRDKSFTSIYFFFINFDTAESFNNLDIL